MDTNKQVVTSQIAAMNAATAQVVTLTSGITGLLSPLATTTRTGYYGIYWTTESVNSLPIYLSFNQGSSNKSLLFNKIKASRCILNDF